MFLLRLTNEDFISFKEINAKISSTVTLSVEEKTFLSSLYFRTSHASKVLSQLFNLDNKLEKKVFSVEEIKPQLQKWCNLFNNLPNNGDENLPYAWLRENEEDGDYQEDNTVMMFAFIPSLVKSNQKGLERIVNIDFKINGTAKFIFNVVEDIENFSELHNFNGSWENTYLLVVKTLQQGWPQIKFPKEFEQFLSLEND